MKKEQKLGLWTQILEENYGINIDDLSNKEIKEIVFFLESILKEKLKVVI